MERSEELEWAVNHSYDRGNYPDVFTDDTGMDFSIPNHPEFFVKPKENKKIKIRITSFQGISPGAIHYYAEIVADGIYLCKEENGIISSVSGYICEEYKQMPKEKKDPISSLYFIEAERDVTQEMIDDDPDRWHGYRAGYKTNAFNTIKEAEEIATRIAKARFQGAWTIEIEEDL